MSNVESSPPPTPTPPARPAFSIVRVLILAVPLSLLVGAVGGYLYVTGGRVENEFDVEHRLRHNLLSPTRLDEGLSDADGDLVADAPKDAAQQLDPETLVFTVLDGDDKAKEVWAEFVTHLAKVTGKKVEAPVERVAYPPEAIAEFRAGKVHIAALSTGTVPALVKQGGFVPLCVMAGPDGTYGYEMEVVVPAASPAREVKDLKGQTLALTSFRSLSGFKAPILLLSKHGLKAGTDYEIRTMSSSRDAIKRVAEEDYAATTVANDYYKRVLDEENIDPGKLRSIHKSETFPPACFGHVYSLKPELAAKVKQAFLTFEWKGTALEKAYRPSNQSKFVAISYKKDWESVRQVDEAVNKLFDQ